MIDIRIEMVNLMAAADPLGNSSRVIAHIFAGALLIHLKGEVGPSRHFQSTSNTAVPQVLPVGISDPAASVPRYGKQREPEAWPMPAPIDLRQCELRN